MLWCALAWSVTLGPTDDLQSHVDDTKVGLIELESGVYDQTLVVERDDLVLRPAPGAVPVFAVFGDAATPALFDIRGSGVVLEGMTLAPTNLDAVRVSGAVSIDGVRITTSGVGRALTFESATGSTVARTEVFGGLSGNGGQVSIRSGRVVVTDSRFEGGSGTEGGSFHTLHGSSLTLSGVLLRDHRATRAGALACHGECVVTGGELSGNVAQDGGGALLVGNGGTLSLSGVDVFENEAETGGGLLNLGHTTVRHSTFCGNVVGAAGDGGAVSTLGGDAFSVSFSRFLHNQAGRGGAVAFESDGGMAEVTFTNLLGNRGVLSGAALQGPVHVRSSWIGLSEGAPALSEDAQVSTSGFFSNAGGVHPTQAFLEAPNPLRGYTPGEVCGLYRDVYGPGSAPVEATEPVLRDELGAIGAYATDEGFPWGRVDADEDGWVRLYDCDDDRVAVYPKNPDDVPYNGSDEDCDGQSDDDADGDGFDAAERGGDDCDDTNSLVHPGALDLDPTVDGNCNGVLEDQPTELSPAVGCNHAGQTGGGAMTLLGLLVWARRRGVTGSLGRRNREHPHPE